MSFLDGVVEEDDRDRARGVKTHLGLCLFTVSITIEDGLAIAAMAILPNPPQSSPRDSFNRSEVAIAKAKVVTRYSRSPNFKTLLIGFFFPNNLY